MGRRKKRYESSSDESDSESSDSSDSSDDSSDESDSDQSSSDSDSSDSDSDSSSSESEEEEDYDEYDEDPKKTKQDIKEIIRDTRLMKFEKAILDDAGINSLARMRDCTERQLKRTGMEYSERDRLLRAFRQHLDERKEKLKGSNKSKGKSSKKSKKSKSSKSKSKSKSKKKSKTDEDPLAKLDTGWSGKKQAWKDYKDHEARVAELVEFYEEIGRKKTNGEEHARKLLVSYPGGIGKLAIALDKKYHHIPYGWEHILEEAQRKEDLDGGSESD